MAGGRGLYGADDAIRDDLTDTPVDRPRGISGWSVRPGSGIAPSRGSSIGDVMKVAIIGAGIAGLSCALRLQQDGCVVTLFDKGRGAGGRMATRRIETPGGMIAFDHGAQYLTMRDPDFVAAMQGWAAAGVVARWPAAGPDAWVGTPGMNAIVGHLAAQAARRPRGGSSIPATRRCSTASSSRSLRNRRRRSSHRMTRRWRASRRTAGLRRAGRRCSRSRRRYRFPTMC
jgi:phytoene dehydrogenase-like protein